MRRSWKSALTQDSTSDVSPSFRARIVRREELDELNANLAEVVAMILEDDQEPATP